MRVAVLGTGIMGAPMARNLLRAGHGVAVWNRTRAKAEALADDGATVAGAPADAVAGADCVLTMLRDGPAVEAVMDDEGVLGALSEDTIWIQASTVGLEAGDRLGRLAAERPVLFVDAPVLGTREPAEQGKLVVLASGPDSARERCAPVFDAIGQKTLWLGKAGRGTRLKLVVNAWLLALTGAAAEAIALAEGLGVEPARFFEAVEGGPVDVPYLQTKGEAMVRREFPASFPLELAAKDVELVREAAGAADVELRLAEALADLFGEAVALGHAEEDMAACVYAAASSDAS